MNCLYDYAVIRVVPRVERGEFVNVGVIVSSHSEKFVAAKIELDPVRLGTLHPGLDTGLIREHLIAFERIAAGDLGAGPIAALPPRERFFWLTAPRSTVIQTSPIHTGRCCDLMEELERLLNLLVR